MLMKNRANIQDREFRGEIAKSMDRLTTRALEAQVERFVERHNALIWPIR